MSGEYFASEYIWYIWQLSGATQPISGGGSSNGGGGGGGASGENYTNIEVIEKYDLQFRRMYSHPTDSHMKRIP